MSLTAKVNYCKRPEIRYITFQEDVCTNYEYVKQKISKIFQIGDNDYSTLKLLWKDEADDLITISCDEELLDAIANRSGDILKLYIKTKKAEDDDGSSSSDNEEDEEEVSDFMMSPPFIHPFGGRRKFCKKRQKKMCKFWRKAFKHGDPRMMFMGLYQPHQQAGGEMPAAAEHHNLPPHGPPPAYPPHFGMRGRPPHCGPPPFAACRGGSDRWARGFPPFWCQSNFGECGEKKKMKEKHSQKTTDESNISSQTVHQQTSDEFEQNKHKKCKSGGPGSISSQFMNECMIVDIDSTPPNTSATAAPSNCCCDNNQNEADDDRIEKTLTAMKTMGFSNEGGWLKILLKEKNCDINEVLNTINIQSKQTTKID